MSLNRLVARLSVVSALNNYLTAPWPTLAGPNIFDSKIEPVEDMKLDRAFPCAVVYTDYDKDHWAKADSDRKHRLMTVTIELLIVQVAEQIETEGQPTRYQLETPTTDSEIETSLDIFEVQIFRALNAGNVASDCFNYLCTSYDNVISRRGASIEGGQRLAARQLTLEMKTPRDNIKGVIPEQIAAFLNKLEEHADYGDRVDDIRAMFTATASETAGEKARKAYGYSTDVGRMLGYEPGPEVLLPPNLTFQLKGG
jgi:hypothetical protein